jgi:tripartite-type tricarboxylate transporter receptor subunit TctC
MKRRDAILLALLAGLARPGVAAGPGFPDRPVHLIVGAGAGSFPDQVARRLADELAHQFGQPVIVHDRPGAGGIIAMSEFIKTPADGYTIALATMSQLVFNRYLFRELPYDADRDLQPIGTILNASMMIVANPSFPARSLADLVSISRSKPGEVDFAIPALGSPPHVVLGMFMDTTRTSFSIIPFKTGADAVLQVVGGEVPLFIDAVPVVAGLVQSGKLRALGVTGKSRLRQFPDVPTVAEQGYPAFVGEAWVGLVARAGTPPPVAARIRAALDAAIRSDSLRQYIESAGGQTVVTSPGEFSLLVQSDVARWGKVIRDMHLSLDR